MYRAGGGALPATNDSVSVPLVGFSDANYRVTVTATSIAGFSTALTPTCEYLAVTNKTTTTFVVTLRSCTNGAAVAATAEITFDWIAIANKLL